MKKIIVILLLSNVTTNMFAMEYLKNLFHSDRTELTKPIKARVEVIPLIDPFSFQQAALTLIAAAKNNRVAGIILIINSGGGSTGSFSVLHDLIKRVSSIKPIVALVAGCANSGGYLIASAAHYIFAHSLSEVGSIGVIIEATKFKNAEVTGDVKAKIDVELFTAGKFKGLFNPYKKLSEEDRAYIQKMIEEDSRQFLMLISKNRNLNIDESTKWADAKIFNAPEALRLGLIDEIGTIFEAEAKILELVRQRNPDRLFDNDIVTNLRPA